MTAGKCWQLEAVGDVAFTILGSVLFGLCTVRDFWDLRPFEPRTLENVRLQRYWRFLRKTPCFVEAYNVHRFLRVCPGLARGFDEFFTGSNLHMFEKTMCSNERAVFGTLKSKHRVFHQAREIKGFWLCRPPVSFLAAVTVECWPSRHESEIAGGAEVMWKMVWRGLV